jgi:hypothetical protein
VSADPERVNHLLNRFGFVHVEMAVGDVLFFHSNVSLLKVLLALLEDILPEDVLIHCHNFKLTKIDLLRSFIGRYISIYV